MNSNTNNSSIAALVDAANQKKNTDKGREALAATQAINNKSVTTDSVSRQELTRGHLVHSTGSAAP